jgi:hypothetical protein
MNIAPIHPVLDDAPAMVFGYYFLNRGEFACFAGCMGAVRERAILRAWRRVELHLLATHQNPTWN